MNRAIAQLCIFVGAVSILSGCATPDTIEVVQSLRGKDQHSSTIGWKIKFDGSGSSPVIADGVLYIGSADGAVYAVDPNTGDTKWRFQTGEGLSREQGIRRRVDMTPAVENGTVFVGSGDHSFYAIDAATGKKRWSYVAGPGMASMTNQSYTRPAAILRNGTVYFVTGDGLQALDTLTGKRKWLFETLQEIPIEQMNMAAKRAPTGLAMGDSAVYVTAWPFIRRDTPRKSFLYAVDPESGKTKWVISVDGLDTTAPVTAKGLAFFAISSPTRLYGIDAADGEVKWSSDGERKFGTPVLLVAENAIYFCTDRKLLALELGTGRQLWRFSADNIGTNLQADDRHLYVVTQEGSLMRPKDTIHALALATGEEKWSQNGYVAMVHDGVVYAGGERISAIDATSGKELWSFKETGRESVRLISGGRIFLVSPTVSYVGLSRVDQGYLYAIDVKTGKLKR